MLLACSFGVSVIPLPWLFASPEFLWPVAIDAVLSGVLWGGHAAAAFALPLSASPKHGRPFYLAAWSMAGGLAFSAATLAGGALAESLPETFAFGGGTFANLHVLFALTSAARFGAALLGARIAEPGAQTLPELLRVLPEVLAPLRARFSRGPANGLDFPPARR